MDNELVIVTAFFDIGRENFANTSYKRSNEQYMEYFDFWARIKNKVIVYTQPDFSKRIFDIRKKYGLENNTKIVEVEDVFGIEKVLLEGMRQIEKDAQFALWGIAPNALSNRADYDYIMLMKYWCLKEAAKLEKEGTVLAWVDFGFNHGGNVFIDEREFSYIWTWKDFFVDRKIHLFAKFDPDDVLACESLQLKYVCIMGCLLIVPCELAERLWELMKSAMEALLMLDAIDDDQLLLMMAYRKERNIFRVHKSDWFLPLKEYGGYHLTCRNKDLPIEKTPKEIKKEQTVLNKIERFMSRNKVVGYNEELALRIFKASHKFYTWQ